MYNITAKRTNILVDTLMIQLGWVFNENSLPGKASFAQVITILAEAPDQSLFSTTLVETLIHHFYDEYYKAVIGLVFIPYIVYFIGAQVFFTRNLDADYHNTGVIMDEILMGAGILYFLYIEVRQFQKGPIDYLTDGFNLFEVTSLLLNIQLLFSRFYEREEEKYLFNLMEKYTAGSLASFLMWFELVYLLRLFENFSYYIILIRNTLTDIIYFMYVYVIVLLAFGFGLYILDNEPYTFEYVPLKFGYGYRIVDSIIYFFLVSLGEFEIEQFGEGTQATTVYLFFIMSTFITAVIILNMLINLMGEAHDALKEVREQSAMFEKIKIVSDHIFLIPDFESLKKTYLFYIQPKIRQTADKTVESACQELKEQITTFHKKTRNEIQQDVWILWNEMRAH